MSSQAVDSGAGKIETAARAPDPLPHSTSTLFPLVYEQLRGLARRRMAAERVGHTLQATGLVNEVFLRLQNSGQLHFSHRGQFFLAAAEAMRRILVEHARARGKLKRGGGRKRVLLNVMDLAADDEQIPQILALDEAIERLEQSNPDVALVVRLRFFAGLTVEETAAALGLSPRTVKREWTYARTILHRNLREENE